MLLSAVPVCAPCQVHGKAWGVGTGRRLSGIWAGRALVLLSATPVHGPYQVRDCSFRSSCRLGKDAGVGLPHGRHRQAEDLRLSAIPVHGPYQVRGWGLLRRQLGRALHVLHANSRPCQAHGGLHSENLQRFSRPFPAQGRKAQRKRVRGRGEGGWQGVLQALQKSHYKVKLTPGTVKKSKAARLALELLMQGGDATGRQYSHALCSKAVTACPNLSCRPFRTTSTKSSAHQHS